jgi:hypothetical protein
MLIFISPPLCHEVQIFLANGHLASTLQGLGLSLPAP